MHQQYYGRLKTILGWICTISTPGSNVVDDGIVPDLSIDGLGKHFNVFQCVLSMDKKPKSHFISWEL